MQNTYDNHSRLEDLGESVWYVSNQGVFFHSGEQNQILRNEEIGVVRLDNDRTHEDLQNEERCGESGPEVDQIRFDFNQERSAAWDRVQEACQKASIEKAKQIDSLILQWEDDRLCPYCDDLCEEPKLRTRQGTSETMFSCQRCFDHPMEKWKRKACEAYLNRPFVEEPNRGNGAW